MKCVRRASEWEIYVCYSWKLGEDRIQHFGDYVREVLMFDLECVETMKPYEFVFISDLFW